MSLLGAESFDNIDLATLALKYPGSSLFAATFPAARTANGLSPNGGVFLHYVDATVRNTIIIGAAVKWTATGSDEARIFNAKRLGAEQVRLCLDSAGRLHIRRGNGQFVTGLAAPLAAGVFHYLEWKMTIHNAVSPYEVKANGKTMLSGVAGNVTDSGNLGADAFGLYAGVGGNQNMVFDDAYFADDAGAVNNTFLGDGRALVGPPDGAGTYSQWTPSAGLNWQNVDDAAQDGDGTYNSSATAGQLDTYQHSNIVLTGAILGIVHTLIAKKTDAGARLIAHHCKSGATESTGPDLALPIGYTAYNRVQETDPNTGAAWTVVNLNAAEFGEKFVS